MSVKITSNISRPLVSGFDTGPVPSLVRTSFIPLKRCHCIRSIHKTSLRSGFESPVQIIGKMMLFIQLGDLHVRAHIDVMDNVAVPLVIGA